MSYEERNTWAFIVIAPVGYALYLVLSFMTGGGPLDAETYVWPMAWAITGGIVAGILTGIVIGMAGSVASISGTRRSDGSARGSAT